MIAIFDACPPKPLIKRLFVDGHRVLLVTDPDEIDELVSLGELDVVLVAADFTGRALLEKTLAQTHPESALMLLAEAPVPMPAHPTLHQPPTLNKSTEDLELTAHLVRFAAMAAQLSRAQHTAVPVRASANQPPASDEGRFAQLGRTVTQVVHEIRNPLTALSAKLQLLRRKTEGIEQVKGLSGSLLEEVDRLGRFLSELLEFGRPRRMSLTPTNPGAVLEEVLAFYRESLDNNQIRVKLTRPVHMPYILCSTEALHQVFQNLLVNAIDATPPDGQITVAASTQGDRLIFEFSNPAEVSDETMSQLFDLFFTTKVHGTGMGLPLVQRLVSDMGGAVHAEADAERITFKVSFPALAAAAVA